MEGCGKIGRDREVLQCWLRAMEWGGGVSESKYPEKPVSGTPDSGSHVDH